MTRDSIDRRGGRAIPWRILGWGLAALLLLLPWLAMQLTAEVQWTAEDFIFAALVFASIGSAFELTIRMSRNIAYRLAVAAALAAAFVILWANGAVGMIGDEGSGYSLLFYGVIGVALAGAVAMRFRPTGMALAMAAAAVVQLAAAAGGLALDPRGAGVSAGLAGLWLVSAALFLKAARDLRASGKD